MAYTTRLGGANGDFASMMQDGFGVVTVMNALVYDVAEAEPDFVNNSAYQIVAKYGKEGTVGVNGYRCKIDTLKVANVTMEGPSKTVTGGQYSNPLIKFGKSARLEMQDALGTSEAIEALCGGVQEWKGDQIDAKQLVGLHFGEDFSGPKMIIGDSFFIDRKSGKQVPVKIVFYQFLPDSIFNLTQDAEGDATVFDMNGDLLTTDILVGNGEKENGTHGVFYSIVDPKQAVKAEVIQVTTNVNPNTAVKINPENVEAKGAVLEFSINGGIDYKSIGSDGADLKKVPAGTKVYVHAVKNGIVLDTIHFAVVAE